MTPMQIHLVRDTLARLEPVADIAASTFYERLFLMDASTRTRFAATDMRQQGRKLMQTLAVVVRGIDDPASVGPALDALGCRHAGYGVADEHYESVGAALLDTLEAALGPAFTPAVRDAWATAYAHLAERMRESAPRGRAAFTVA